MKSIMLILLLATFTPASDISMLGIKIGDSNASLSKLKLKIVAQEDEMIKYRTANGNDFAITTENGKVVYMENDWLHSEKGKQPLFSDFQFGVTSLHDIREKFKTNGFTYANHGAFKTKTDIIEFNCFEFDSPNNEILVAITKISLSENVTEQNVSEKLKLDAIIIAGKDYLDKIWGKEKAFDHNYKKIKP